MDVLGDGISDISILDRMGNDFSTVRAARVSFNRDVFEPHAEHLLSEKDKKLIHYLADHDHGTPFEHNAVQFHVACPLFVRSQWHRHRIGWSYNEISRRYTAEDIQFYVPKVWRFEGDTDNKQGSVINKHDTELHQLYLDDIYLQGIQSMLNTYIELKEEHVANELARLVLPESTYTRFYATANLRSIIHFIRLRSDSHAQWEIRQYSNAMYHMVKEFFPVAMEALIDFEIPEPVDYGG